MQESRGRRMIALHWPIALVLALLPASAAIAQTLVNPSFEDPRLTPGTADFFLVDASMVPGWSTTAADNLIEIWTDGFIFPSFDMDQHVELNANLASTLFQDLPGVPASAITSFQFAHRGRSGVDTIRLTITDLGADGMPGGGDDTVLFTRDYATDNTAWVLYTSAPEPPIVALGNTMRLAFESVSAAGGNQAVGNLLDAVDFGGGVITGPVTEIPTLDQWGFIALLLGLGLAGLIAIRRRAV